MLSLAVIIPVVWSFLLSAELVEINLHNNEEINSKKCYTNFLADLSILLNLFYFVIASHSLVSQPLRIIANSRECSAYTSYICLHPVV